MDHQGRDIIEHTDADVVELVFRPTRADILTGIRTRDRVRRLAVLRGALVALFAVAVVVGAVKGAAWLSLVLYTVCGVVIWCTPRFQANHVLRTVSWQGDYRATVTTGGVTVETEHTVLTQRWSVFRGHRETRDHLVLLSRDPSILVIAVLPKRGLGAESDLTRLRDLLAAHLPRV
ncbi:YcxB family protein [Streptomyces sp. HMX87]|uniref:YcxB family protein n=1 Tax=Streptomyces sp. HMX87 TaxID=3390849 RepID=UPI003A891AA5